MAKYKIERDQLIRLRVVFVDKMGAMSNFIDHAMALNLLRKDHKNAIMSDSNPENQTRKMLDFVEKKLPSKSDAFLEALLRSGNDLLAHKLVPQETISHLQTVFDVEVEPSDVEFNNQYSIENFSQSRVKCVDYMSDMSTFLDYALQVNLLNRQDRNKILSKENADQQTREMCNIMDTKLPEKSDPFLYCLTESGNEYLVDLLLSQPKNSSTCDFSHLASRNPTSRTRGDSYPEYQMRRRGRVLIIENVKFDNNPALNRYGSEADRKAVVDFFGGLGFEIILRSDLTAEGMEKVLHEQIQNEKGSNEDCFILFIMSHGRESEIYGTDMKSMNYSVIFKEFNESLIWNKKSEPKPKLIYIQACQPSDEAGDATDARKVSSHVTPDGHVYIMYATIPGGFALRHTVTGSRLIQAVITVFKENHSREDIETMGIKIKSLVYRNSDSDNIQIALSYSCMPKRVYLTAC